MTQRLFTSFSFHCFLINNHFSFLTSILLYFHPSFVSFQLNLYLATQERKKGKISWRKIWNPIYFNSEPGREKRGQKLRKIAQKQQLYIEIQEDKKHFLKKKSKKRQMKRSFSLFISFIYLIFVSLHIPFLYQFHCKMKSRKKAEENREKTSCRKNNKTPVYKIEAKCIVRSREQ
jgi:hypothetical protein